ncbi:MULTISPECIES: chloride channel protein [unclassified Pseudovibrio]|uniref:chloride channel protein n=1 Tax=unclassified Pseudovibrio TaxID=2627060 RepID=UPI0007AE5200|nr:MULTISPECIES: chloride channel protein [unclassified Pseudovibrio]KZK94769.1 H(+)/Cl(-) exchange transporter ClcA [Pseudovibrio sp. W74]KZL04672.1 H(+)/Cl(-) exchange transporter ClcA [Pseudovibrio sp. Ad14]
MPNQANPLKIAMRIAYKWVEPNLRLFMSSRLPLVWLLALIIGAAVGGSAILFRIGIGLVQWLSLGTVSERMISAANAQPWYVIVLAPVIGGAIVGLLLQTIQKKQRAGGVADVIEARAHGGTGLPFWPGLSSALITVISLGSGASAGREGPMVHLGATLGTSVFSKLKLPDSTMRILLAAGVASAVSASFNAPIAGVLFAHEVILGHYAMSAFVPIVLSSAMGTLVSRLYFGEAVAFILPHYQINTYWEFPAFVLLGIICAIVAISFQFALIGSDWLARNIKMPIWLRPIIGGALVGSIAVFYPEIIGVGYEATDGALNSELPLTLMLSLLVVKTVATAITLASRFGGGIFSPSLYLGAMTGGAFGLIAANHLPEMASSHGLYAILGMGAVASAVLGAPISTTMIVFELTGGYELSIALLIAVSVSTGLNQAIHGRSYFHWQLEMRGVMLQDGAHKWLVRIVHVEDFADPPRPDSDTTFDPVSEEPFLAPLDTLEKALRTFDDAGKSTLPVIDPKNPAEVIGYASHVKALRYFNSALIQANVEEHR